MSHSRDLDHSTFTASQVPYATVQIADGMMAQSSLGRVALAPKVQDGSEWGDYDKFCDKFLRLLDDLQKLQHTYATEASHFVKIHIPGTELHLPPWDANFLLNNVLLSAIATRLPCAVSENLKTLRFANLAVEQAKENLIVNFVGYSLALLQQAINHLYDDILQLRNDRASQMPFGKAALVLYQEMARDFDSLYLAVANARSLIDRHADQPINKRDNVLRKWDITEIYCMFVHKLEQHLQSLAVLAKGEINLSPSDKGKVGESVGDLLFLLGQIREAVMVRFSERDGVADTKIAGAVSLGKGATTPWKQKPAFAKGAYIAKSLDMGGILVASTSLFGAAVYSAAVTDADVTNVNTVSGATLAALMILLYAEKSAIWGYRKLHSYVPTTREQQLKSIPHGLAVMWQLWCLWGIFKPLILGSSMASKQHDGFDAWQTTQLVFSLFLAGVQLLGQLVNLMQRSTTVTIGVVGDISPDAGAKLEAARDRVNELQDEAQEAVMRKVNTLIGKLRQHSNTLVPAQAAAAVVLVPSTSQVAAVPSSGAPSIQADQKEQVPQGFVDLAAARVVQAGGAKPAAKPSNDTELAVVVAVASVSQPAPQPAPVPHAGDVMRIGPREHSIFVSYYNSGAQQPSSSQQQPAPV